MCCGVVDSRMRTARRKPVETRHKPEIAYPFRRQIKSFFLQTAEEQLLAVLLVSYDLRQPGRDYKPVHDYLRTFEHCKPLESLWLIDTGESTSVVRDSLRRRMDQNDKVLVIKCEHTWHGSNLGCGEWLNSPLRHW